MIPTLTKSKAPAPSHCFSLFPLLQPHPFLQARRRVYIYDLSPHTNFSSTELFLFSPSLSVLLFAYSLSGLCLLFTEMAPMLKLIDCSLRLSVIPLSVATIWLTVTNHQDNSSYGNLHYSNLMGLKYMVCMSAICAVYAFVAAVSLWIRFLVNKVWWLFVSDQIITYLMVTSVAAIMELLYLAYNGDQKVTWSEACRSYGKFCTRMKLALILHAVALFCFIVLAVISSYRAFSTFETPVSSKEVEEDTS
ncbi:CASP-like protein 2D1 isoform X2 [Hevea brasiliensis]|nr:CASP-like protein 2D1 isoform X2 [Hevea brasiliensis]